jgi:hypothetical protein
MAAHCQKHNTYCDPCLPKILKNILPEHSRDGKIVEVPDFMLQIAVLTTMVTTNLLYLLGLG